METIKSRSAALRIGVLTALKLIPHFCRKGRPAFLRACTKAISIVWNMRDHLRLLQILTLPHAIDLARSHPRLAYRYLNPYLALGFSRRNRLDSMAHHYAYLQDRVTRDFLHQVYIESPTVWTECHDEHRLEIQLCFPKEHDGEGDFRLDFVSDSARIYSITFTITQGSLVDVEVQHVLLIAGIQGESKKIALIRAATQMCDDTSPPHLLLSAAQGVARALGIFVIAGVGTEQQISNEDSATGGFVFDYDRFWQSLTGDTRKKKFYVMPVPLQEKPIEQVRANRRARTLRRRALRNRVAQQTVDYIKRHLTSSGALV